MSAGVRPILTSGPISHINPSPAPSLFAIGLLFAAGAILSAGVPALPSAAGLVLLAVLSLILMLFRATRLVAVLLLGALWFLVHAWQFQHQAWPATRAGEAVEVVATVSGVPVQRDGRARLEIVPDRVARAAAVPKRLLVEWYRPREWFRPGETWRFELTLEPPGGRVNPGLFDYHRYLISRGIGATGQIAAAERVADSGLLAAPDRLRQRFADWLQAEIADLEAAALARALTVADRSAMSPQLAEQLQRTGTAHLLSISGLHVGMVAALIGLLAALVATPLAPWFGWPDRRRVGLLAGLLGALLYALLAGFTLPTLRALVMLVAGFGALLLRRAIRPGHALVMALLAVLLLDPMAPLATGFWLSFGAVAVLIWGFAGRTAARSPLISLLRAQLLIAVGMLPLNLGVFGEWAPTALAANLVAIPLIGFWVLPLLLLALAGFGLGLPVGLALAGAEAGLKLLLWILDRLAQLDADVLALGQLALPAPSLLAIALALIGAGWLLAPRGWPLRPAGALLLLPLLWPGRDSLQPGEFDLLLPDLGDGHAVLVRSREHALLYGTGSGDGGDQNQIDRSLEPLLRQQGVRAPDWVVVPSLQRDYAGGAFGAASRWPGAVTWTSQYGQPRRCTAGTAWTADGLDYEFLHPGTALPDLGPDSACVLEIRSAAGSVLLPGPVGRTVQRRLLLQQQARPIDVLVLPAAGHRQALDPDWLALLRPQMALATVRARHPRGLPHDEWRAALARLDVPLATTAGCGAIRLQFRLDRPPELTVERRRSRRFWRDSAHCPDLRSKD